MPALNALKAFEMAGRTGSFTRAAELLNVTQSAVSRRFASSRASSAKPLLERRHHQLELTAPAACRCARCSSRSTRSS